MALFFNILSHLYPLQVENCDNNSRLVADEDDNGKFRLVRVNMVKAHAKIHNRGKPYECGTCHERFTCS